MGSKERAAALRQRRKEQGLKLVQLWLDAAEAAFVVAYFAQAPEEREAPVERVGREATARQLRVARIWATRAGLELPDYAKTHHISLMGWIDYARKLAYRKNPAAAYDETEEAGAFGDFSTFE